MIGSNRVRTRPFTRLQEHALATKHELPLTTANSNYVQLFYNQAEYSLGLYERASDVEPRFIAKLRDASIVNNTTEKGPCLFLICKNGHFEFQTTGKEMFSDWLQTFKDCGIPLIPFSQLYKVQKSVGEGSFAKVYLARHMYTNQEVCIKAIDKGRVQTSNVYTEIEVLRKVAHPYINRLFAAYENDKTICLVLEYLKGGELFEYLSKKGPYNEIHAKLAFRRILSGLNCLHRKGIVHRDLKTENLILEEENSPTSLKIIDFGLASTLGSPTMTMRCGSPGYVAPEILQEMPYGIKVDLFSAGVILYTVLGGYPPFRGANIREILKANVRCKVSFNHPRWNPVSQYAKDLILWMTNKNADCRCSATQALGHPWFEGVPQSLPQSVPSRASETYAIVPARAPKKVVVVAKKAAVPEVGSASTCASPGGSGLSPFSAEATSSTASNAQQSNHPRPVAAANVAAVAAAAAGGHAGKTTPYLPQTVTTNGVRTVSSTTRAADYGDAAANGRPRPRVRQTVDELAILASSSIKDTTLITGGPVAMWQPVSGVESATADSSAATPVYRRIQSKPFNFDNRPMLPPSEGHSPAYNRTRTRAKTGAANRNEQSDMVKSAARAVAVAKVDDGNKLQPQAKGMSAASIAPNKSVTGTATWRTRSMHCDVEGGWGLGGASSGLDDVKGVWSKHWLKTRDGKELEALLDGLTASDPLLPLHHFGEGWQTWRQGRPDGNTPDRICVTSAYFKACRYAPSRASIMSLGRQASSRLGQPVDFSGLDTWEDSVPSRRSPTGAKTVRFRPPSEEVIGQTKRSSKGEMAPALLRYHSMPVDPDSDTDSTIERRHIVKAESSQKHPEESRSVQHSQQRSRGAGYDPYTEPAVGASRGAVHNQQECQSSSVSTAAPAPHQPPSTQTTSSSKSPSPLGNFLRFATGRQRLSNVDRLPACAAPPDPTLRAQTQGTSNQTPPTATTPTAANSKGKIVAARTAAGPAPVSAPSTSTTTGQSKRSSWRAPFKR
eukprot:Lankesteria_metandrocarpae@DN5427_c1_g1_i7.p1